MIPTFRNQLVPAAAVLLALLLAACGNSSDGHAAAMHAGHAPTAMPMPATKADATAAPAAAQPATQAPATLHATGAWIRLLPGDLPAGGYVEIVNEGDSPRRLVSARSDAFGMAMLHQSQREGGMARMRHVDGIAVPAHGSAALAPGGYHLMLMQPTRALAPGQTVELELVFDDGATLHVPFAVRPANAGG